MSPERNYTPERRWRIYHTIVLLFGLVAIGLFLQDNAIGERGGNIRVDRSGTSPAPLVAPSATPINIRPTLIHAITLQRRSVSRLETEEMRIAVDVAANRDPRLNLIITYIGGENLVLHMEGTVIGRIDMGAMTIDPELTFGDIVLSKDGKKLTITLPPPELVTVLDADRTVVREHSLGWFAESNHDMWLALQKYGVAQFTAHACAGEILPRTRDEAKRQLEALFAPLVDQVVVQVRPHSLCGS